MKAVAGLPEAMGMVVVGSLYHCSVPEPVPVSVTIPGPHRVTLVAVGTGMEPTVIVTELEVSDGHPISVTIARYVFDWVNDTV